MHTDDATDPTLDAVVPPTDSDLRVTVFVHSVGPAPNKPSQDRLVAALRSLADRDVLDDVDLLVWGSSICPSSPLTDLGSGRRILDAVTEFYDLTADSDLSIAPFFSVSTVTTAYGDEAFERIVPPSRAVAVYEGSELAAVFPCLVDGTAYTPEDLVAHLRGQRTAAAGPAMVDESA
ncbi:HTH domain-containing protein [Haloarcula laminariae]|uniref:HTH domain-containing protein n=1 Tax=Haloarcula laminariae TaxID=2961577 RepID=UPI0021C7F7BA|nr:MULTISPECIES: HTH domain-containing protein [Halomicroarcula]